MKKKAVKPVVSICQQEREHRFYMVSEPSPSFRNIPETLVGTPVTRPRSPRLYCMRCGEVRELGK